MQTAILHAEVAFIERALRVPLHLSSGVITAITEARAAVTVRVGAREATGRGAMYLSGQWAWPRAGLGHAARDAALRATCRAVADGLPALCGEAAHPLDAA